MTEDTTSTTVAPAGDLSGLPELAGRVHFIGIGGAGMSGVARLMLAKGIAVSGSDARASATLDALASLGATVYTGLRPDVLADVATVVVSSAIRDDNPELQAARQYGCTVLHRARALAAVMAGRQGIAVTGTAGKTSTTSMLTVAVQACGADPSFAIGGDVNETGTNAHYGTGDLFIVEADESDGSFLAFSPFAGVVTNIEADHLDQHGTPEAYAATFVEFVSRISPNGFLVTNADDIGTQLLAVVAREKSLPVVTFGETPGATLQISDLELGADQTSYQATFNGADLGRVTVGMPGHHVALNSAGALLAALQLGLPAEQLIAALASFQGVRRRFELKGTAAGVRVYDDYAHHPTKVEAQLKAARLAAGSGQVIVVFQPHLYSRTRDFAADFGQALGIADQVILMDIFAAREDPMPGVTSALIAAAISLPADQVCYQPSWSAVPAEVVARARPGDVVITMGAGDVTLLGSEIITALDASSSPA